LDGTVILDGYQPASTNLTAWALLNPATLTTNDFPGIDFGSGTGGGTLQDAVQAQGGTPVTNVPSLHMAGTIKTSAGVTSIDPSNRYLWSDFLNGPMLDWDVDGTGYVGIDMLGHCIYMDHSGTNTTYAATIFFGTHGKFAFGVGTNMVEIDDVESTLTDNTNAVPTSAAVVDYVAAHGGGGTSLVIEASSSIAVVTNGVTRTLSVKTGGVGATELAATAVAAGSYTGPYTVDADGRITAAANFSQPATNSVATLTPVGTTGTLTGASAYWQWRLTTNSTLTATMTDFPTNRTSAIALSIYYGTKSLTFTTGTVFSASSVALLATPSTTAWNLYSITKGYGATTLTVQGPIQ
jgi:hypothetical protein